MKRTYIKIIINTVMTVTLLLFLVVAGADADDALNGSPNQVRLSLEEAIQMALENNLDLRIERYNPQTSQENIRVAEAAFAPTFSANSGYTRNESENPNTALNVFSGDTGLSQKFLTGASYKAGLSLKVSDYADDPSGTGEEQATSYNSSLSLTLTQPLLKDRGTEVNTIKIVTAENNYESSLSKLRSTVSDIVVNVMNAYWNLIQDRGTLEADQYALQLANDLVKSNEAQVKVGTLAPIEVLQAQATAASREVQIISDEQQVRNREDALRQLLNIPEHDPLWQAELIPTSELTAEVVNLSLEENIQIALENREEIVRQEILLENQTLSLTATQNALLPELNAQATFGLTGNDEALGKAFGNLMEFDSYSAGISLNFSYPLGNQAAESEHRKAQLNHDQAVLSLQNLEQQIATQVRQAVRAVETSYRQIEAAGIAKQLAEEQLSAEQKKFNSGLSTNFRVLDFQESLASAQNKYTQAIVSYNKALISLDEALGLLLQRRNIVVNEIE